MPDGRANRRQRVLAVGALVAVTLVTQVTALALALAWLAARRLLAGRTDRRQRAGFGFLIFAASYGLLHFLVVPPIAALAGRVPLPCAADADRPFAAANPMFCWLDRHYVDPRLTAGEGEGEDQNRRGRACTTPDRVPRAHPQPHSKAQRIAPP